MQHYIGSHFAGLTDSHRSAMPLPVPAMLTGPSKAAGKLGGGQGVGRNGSVEVAAGGESSGNNPCWILLTTSLLLSSPLTGTS